MAQVPKFLSFNTQVSPGLASWQPPTPAEVEDMQSKDPPLRYTWTIWEQIMLSSDAKASQYADSTHKVASFNTVKGFWKYWSHLPQPSELLGGKKFIRETPESRSVVDALMLFRDGIKPEWEDPTNASGGHFQYQLKTSLGGGVIDEYWNNIVMGMVGGTIEPQGMLTGVRLVDKLAQSRTASVRIEVWFANFDDAAKVKLLEENVEKCMCLGVDGKQTGNTWGKTERKPHGSQKK